MIQRLCLLKRRCIKTWHTLQSKWSVYAWNTWSESFRDKIALSFSTNLSLSAKTRAVKITTTRICRNMIWHNFDLGAYGSRNNRWHWRQRLCSERGWEREMERTKTMSLEKNETNLTENARWQYFWKAESRRPASVKRKPWSVIISNLVD